MERVVVRPYAGYDRSAVEQVFDATAFGGATTELFGAELYREACLDWYLGPGAADAAVAIAPDGTLIGYALVCGDGPAAARFAGRMSTRLARHVVGGALTGRLNEFSRAFYRGRARDARSLRVVARRPPAPVHAHLNVLPGRGRSLTGVRLVAHVDEVCRRRNAVAWYGEVNERGGRRASALARLGFEVVQRARSHTLSLVEGTEVDRLLVRRDLSVAPQSDDPIARITAALDARAGAPAATSS